MRELAEWVSTLIGVFILCIIVRIILSWVPMAPVSRAARAIVDFFHETTDWYLRFFRRLIPSIGPLDLSPMVAILVLVIAREFAVRIILSGA